MKRTGMTLLEITAALAILAMVASAALSVCSNLLRSQRVREPQTQAAKLHQGLTDLLREDLLHADGWRGTANGFAIQTHASLDGGSLERSHMPSEVVYQCLEIEGNWWLMRLQRSGRSTHTELVCQGVSGIDIVGQRQSAAAGQWLAVPDCVKVQVQLASQDQSTTLVIRSR